MQYSRAVRLTNNIPATFFLKNQFFDITHSPQTNNLRLILLG